MSTVDSNKSFKTYVNEYSDWNSQNQLKSAKKQEYLLRHPNAIGNYDIKRSLLLLNAVDIMDKSVSKNSNNVDTAFESVVDVGLGYAAVGGTTLGIILSNLGFVKKLIDKITKNNPKTKNIVSMAITATSGALGILAAYPLYSFVTKIESKIQRKRKFETMENELNDPKLFVVLNEEQDKIFRENINNSEKNKKEFFPKKVIKKNYKYFKEIAIEAMHYDKRQNEFKKKYEDDISLYNKALTDEKIKDAKRDRALLTNLIKNINRKAQSYEEKMQRITDNMITMSFALGSLFTLLYEQMTKFLNVKSSALPAGMNIFLIIGSTFFATWAQKRAAHIGRFKAKQELIKDPGQLIYISSSDINTIKDDEVTLPLDKSKKTDNNLTFLKDFFKYNKEYKKWKHSDSITGQDISKALENIEISDKQITDAKRLQRNLFKTFYKVDKNTQNYSGKIEVFSESIKFPITLILGTIGSVWGMKHIANLRKSLLPKEALKHTAKYIATISLFTLPSLIVNSYFAKAQKIGARVSDMLTMKDLEDYRFFADYTDATDS